MSSLNPRLLFILSFYLLVPFTLKAQQFTAENIATFIVDSIELKNPFAGGLNSPQISNADLNNDGLMDVLIFDRIGSAIVPMIREADGYTFDPSYAENFPVIEHFLLMLDYNADGIEDIFCYSIDPGVGGVSVFKGKYTNGKIDFDLIDPPNFPFTVLEFQLSNNSYANILVGRIDIPAFEDIDSDGDIDIVTFSQSGGFIEYYQNLSVEQGGNFDDFPFIKVDDCYGGVFESGLTEEILLPDSQDDCANRFAPDIVSTRHTGSTLLNMDHDGDGDFELLIGDIGFANITLLENAGIPNDAYFNRQILFYPDMASEPVDIEFFPAAFYTDVDGDNVNDLLACPNNINASLDINSVWFYKNTGEEDEPIFELESKNHFVSDMLDLGTNASPTFADVNGDGLQDLVMGTESRFAPQGAKDARLHLFLNVGTITAPSFELVDDNWLDFRRFNSLKFDFVPTFADLDSDGDLDLYVGESAGNIFQVINTAGSGQAMDFGQIIPNFQDIDIGLFSTPTFYDADKDGLLDLIIGERNGNINFLKNIGSPSNPLFDSDLASPNISESYGQIDTRTPATGSGHSIPVFLATESGDVLITGTNHGALQMYGISTDIDSEFPLLDETLGDIRIGAQVAPAFIDIDSDGYYEAFIGNRRGGLSGFNTDFKIPVVSTDQNTTQQKLSLVSTLVKDKIEIKESLFAEMRVYSSLGQEVIPNTVARQLDVTNLSPGVYFVILKDNGLTATQKFVKM